MAVLLTDESREQLRERLRALREAEAHLEDLRQVTKAAREALERARDNLSDLVRAIADPAPAPLFEQLEAGGVDPATGEILGHD